MSGRTYKGASPSLYLDDSPDIYVPLLSGTMATEDKIQHDVRASSADSPRLGDSSSTGDAAGKAPWWSYFWVRRQSLITNLERSNLTACPGL